MRQPVDSGRRGGFVYVVKLYFELCESATGNISTQSSLSRLILWQILRRCQLVSTAICSRIVRTHLRV